MWEEKAKGKASLPFSWRVLGVPVWDALWTFFYPPLLLTAHPSGDKTWLHCQQACDGASLNCTREAGRAQAPSVRGLRLGGDFTREHVWVRVCVNTHTHTHTHTHSSVLRCMLLVVFRGVGAFWATGPCKLFSSFHTHFLYDWGQVIYLSETWYCPLLTGYSRSFPNTNRNYDVQTWMCTCIHTRVHTHTLPTPTVHACRCYGYLITNQG